MELKPIRTEAKYNEALRDVEQFFDNESVSALGKDVLASASFGVVRSGIIDDVPVYHVVLQSSGAAKPKRNY